jgi:hypothetical protein
MSGGICAVVVIFGIPCCHEHVCCSELEKTLHEENRQVRTLPRHEWLLIWLNYTTPAVGMNSGEYSCVSCGVSSRLDASQCYGRCIRIRSAYLREWHGLNGTCPCGPCMAMIQGNASAHACLRIRSRFCQILLFFFFFFFSVYACETSPGLLPDGSKSGRAQIPISFVNTPF